MFQELPTISEYFTSVDEKIFIGLRRRKRYTNEIEKLNRDDSDLTITIKLKAAEAKKIRQQVTGYYQGEFLYLMSREGTYYELQKIWSKQVKKRSKLRAVRVAKKPYLKNGRLILGNGKKSKFKIR